MYFIEGLIDILHEILNGVSLACLARIFLCEFTVCILLNRNEIFGYLKVKCQKQIDRTP